MELKPKGEAMPGTEEKAALAGTKPMPAPASVILRAQSRYSMLVTDLDNTLLDEEKNASAEDLAAIRRLTDAGFLFTFATGRGPGSTGRYFVELGANVPAIIFNGARIMDFASGRVLFNATLNREPAIRAIKHAKSLGLSTIAFGAESCLTEKADYWKSYYEKATGAECLLVDDLAEHSAALPSGMELTKLILFSEPERRDEIVGEFTRAFPEFHIVGTTPNYTEILPFGISKGFALEKLAKYLGVELASIVAVGDAPNDIEMIKCSGLGAAVANADDVVKAYADITVKQVGKGGIAELISIAFGL